MHAFAAMVALVLGGGQLILPKGTAAHFWVGRLWVALMAVVATSSFFIFEIKLWGPFSPIHLLSIWTLGSLIVAIRAARKGDIRRHRIVMTSLFWLALVLTGAFTFLPGRIMHQVVFGS